LEFIGRVEVYGRGHKNVRATHKTTAEFTVEKEISTRADCILLVDCDKGLKDFPDYLKEAVRSLRAVIVVKLIVGGRIEVFTGRGDPRLTYDHPTDIVVRKSDFICSRTLMVRSDKAAIDVDREIVSMLKRGAEGKAVIEVFYS